MIGQEEVQDRFAPKEEIQSSSALGQDGTVLQRRGRKRIERTARGGDKEVESVLVEAEDSEGI